MRATNAPSPLPIRLHPDAAAVEVQALYRGLVIGSRCLVADEAGTFLIGSAKGVDAPAAAHLLAGEAHPLVSSDAGGFSIELTEQMTGTVIFEDHAAPLADLLRAHGPHFVPPPAARLQIACGDVAFLVSATAPPPVVPRRAPTRLEDHWPALLSAAGLLLTMLFLAFLPPDTLAITGEAVELRREWLRSVVVPPAPPPAPAGAAIPGGKVATSTAGGAAGARPSHRPTPSPARRATTRPRGSAPEDLGRRGILGVLLAHEGESWAALFSPDDTLKPGPLDGLSRTDGPGGGPDGPIGLPLGGPGGGEGPLLGDGSGRMIGHCDAACQAGIRVGETSTLRWRRHETKGPQIAIGETTVRGNLDRDTVRRIIRRHLNEVKFCYEQQLPRHPELAGRISVQFTIASSGAVVGSLLQSSTVGNVAVESCVVQAVRRWDFPQPQGGGAVIVSYPFVLVPAGG
jgi:hypothetical protein